MFHKTKHNKQIFPFGCLVLCRPGEDTQIEDNRHAWDARGVRAIFAGYIMHSVYNWSGKYLVWPLENLSEIDLRVTSTHRNQKVGDPIAVRRCELPVEGGLTFPLKEEYDRVNNSFLDPRFYDVEVKDDEEDPIGAPRLPKVEVKPEEVKPEEEGETKSELLLERESEATPHGEDEPGTPTNDEPDPYPPLPPKGDEPRPRYTTFRHPQGHLVQVDRRDRPYRVDSEGTRFFEHAGRPSYMPPEDWRKCRREAKKGGANRLPVVGHSRSVSEEAFG